MQPTPLHICFAQTSHIMSIWAVQQVSYQPWATGLARADALNDTPDEIAVAVSKGAIIVAIMDDSVVAVGRFHQLADTTYIHRLCTHPIHQYHGIGRMILNEIERMAYQRASLGIRLRVPRENSGAVQFLTRVGYSQPYEEEIDEATSNTHYLFQRLLSPVKLSKISNSLLISYAEVSTLTSMPTFERIGVCQRTGKCCSRIFLARDGKFLTGLEAIKLSEYELSSLNEFTASTGVILNGELDDGTAIFRCKQLTYSPEGLAVCKFYGSPDLRPPVCNAFPVSPSSYRYLSCGISFRPVKTASTEIKSSEEL